MTDYVVYIAYDIDGKVLYVGMSGNVFRRLIREHRRLAAWWTLVDRLDIEHLPTHHAACSREAQLIRELQPPYNRAGLTRVEVLAKVPTTKADRPSAEGLTSAEKAAVFAPLMAAHERVVAYIESLPPQEAYDEATRYGEAVQDMTKMTTLVMAQTAYRIWEAEGLSYAELALRIGRTKPRAAQLVAMAKADG